MPGPQQGNHGIDPKEMVDSPQQAIAFHSPILHEISALATEISHHSSKKPQTGKNGRSLGCNEHVRRVQ